MCLHLHEWLIYPCVDNVGKVTSHTTLSLDESGILMLELAWSLHTSSNIDRNEMLLAASEVKIALPGDVSNW